MSENNSYKESLKVIQSLISTFPNCFSKEGAAKPLKKGIFQDLVKALELETEGAVISKVKLRRALRVYTEQWRYLHAFVEGAKRVNLQGELGDEITPTEIEFAQNHLNESKKRYFDWKKSIEAKRNAEASSKNKPKKDVNQSIDKQVKKTEKNATKKSDFAGKTSQSNSVAVNKENKNLKVAELTQLKIGDTVYVSMGVRPIKGIISELDKTIAKVKLDSGMELSVQAALLSV